MALRCDLISAASKLSRFLGGLLDRPSRAGKATGSVLAADVAGYSRFMGIDDERTLARLKAARSVLVDPAIGAHRGRIVKTTGDGLLVEFASAVDAARSDRGPARDGRAERRRTSPTRGIEFRIAFTSATSSSIATTSSETASYRCTAGEYCRSGRHMSV